ncbi:MAG: hypothetical protein WAU47_04625 [Desulfobaccales bacterium]
MSEPEITLEIRWFFPGTISEKEVKDWFLQNPRFGDRFTEKNGKKREDLYFRTPGHTGIGPKLREGRFEIKLLQGQQELELAGAVSGRTEVWYKWKWSYAKGKKDKKISDLVSASFLAGTPEHSRVTVAKIRWLRKFTVEGPGKFVPVSKSQKDLTWWISTEITGVQVKDSPWWTLALEVYGNPDEPMPKLEQSLLWLIEDYPGPPLRMANSQSYPEWLARL